MSTKGLGKGLGALISMFDEDLGELTGNAAIENHKQKVVTRVTTVDERKAEMIRSTAEADKDKLAAISAVARSITEINIDLIDNNMTQPRRSFDAEEMRELEQSIATHGVLQPILLNKVGSRYMVVAGERRWRAAKAVGLKSIPALVRNYSPRQIAEISLVENLLRSDLNEIEVALGIKKLMDTYLMTQEQVSTVLSKSRSTVANSLRILNLPKEVQALLEAKKISMGHAKCLVTVTDKAQCTALANKCAAGNMTVRELEAATSGKPWNKELTVPKLQSLELKELVNCLTQALATKVQIQGDERKGKLIIEYTSAKDLERIKSKIR